MARPKKKGLNYFSFDVDFFSDKKIKRLRAKFGNNGVAVYIYLLCEIYRKSYYIDYDEDLILDISDEMNISENATRQILNYLLSRSLFDDTLAKSAKVLTAASIQRRYLKAKSASSNAVEIEDQYCLLKSEDIDTSSEVYPENSFSDKNVVFSENNRCKSEKNNTKESKVNEKYLLTSGNQPENLSTVSTTPTFKEVVACIEEIGGGVNAQKFYNYYSSRGWKDKNGVPIDLKTSVIHWQNTEGKFKSKPKSKSESIPESPMADAYRGLVFNLKE